MIALIKQRLFECGAHFFPEMLSSEISLSPCLNLKWGDLESDIVFVLAERLRKNPDLVCKEVLEFLNGFEGLRVSATHNYINFTLKDSVLLKEQLQFTFSPETFYPVRFAIPKGVVLNERFRLLGAALFQVCIGSAYGYRSELGRFGDTVEPGSGPLYLWLYPETIQTGLLRRASQEYSKLGRKLFINAPFRSWLTMDSSLNFSRVFESFSGDQLASLLFLLSSPRRGLEVDLETAKLEESANIIWLTRTLIPRIARALEEKSESFDFDQQIKLEELLRKVVHRTVFLPEHLRIAIEEGKVIEFVSVLEDFLTALNKLMGIPSYRQRLLAAGDGVTAKILTGALNRLSDIISLYDKVEAGMRSSLRGCLSEFSSE
jgi:hypothetical protein